MLTVNGLVTSYGGIAALRGVDLSVEAGSVVALIGANGAGKSTLINSVSGAIRSQAGSIMFNGRPIEGLPSYSIARFGLIQVPEGRRILAPFTVRENLELGWHALGGRAKPDRNDFAHIYKLFPRLEERQSQLAGSLSGGEQQMLAIGRALMARPLMLLLDEPSLGLAPIIVSQVFETIKFLNSSGLTLLVVEQNARRALEVADFAYVLERGRVVRAGTTVELRSDPIVQEAYFGGSSQK